jgi:hypothetical protein
MLTLFSLLVGCSPEPASIKFNGEPTMTVHTLDAVDVEKATVMDKDGKALDPQPTVSWTVNPPTVAKLDGAKVVPVGNGDASVTAQVGEVKNQYKFVVALPDKVEIAGYTAGTPWPVGQSTTLTATVKAGDATVDGQKVEWSSSDANIAEVDANGAVMGKAEGAATITAKSGDLSATVDVTIGGAAVATTEAAPAAPTLPPPAQGKLPPPAGK